MSRKSHKTAVLTTAELERLCAFVEVDADAASLFEKLLLRLDEVERLLASFGEPLKIYVG